MSRTNSKRRNDPGQDQDQDQDQKQANLQAQLQGQLQGQGQAQGQAQLAVQALDSKSENDNENDNENSNDNKLDNKVDNDLDNKVNNSLDNKVDNGIDNKIENTIENNVDVNVKVDLELSADDFVSPVIDLSCLSDVKGSVIIPDVVNQTTEGDGNIFNIDQVNNLIDSDYVHHASVAYSGGHLDIDAKAEGGDAKLDARLGDVIGNEASGAAASADAAQTLDAFSQTITQGANIQFNSITMNVAGGDFEDSHDLG